MSRQLAWAKPHTRVPDTPYVGGSANQPLHKPIHLRDLVVNLSDHTVMREGSPCRLTSKEWGVFETLCAARLERAERKP